MKQFKKIHTKLIIKNRLSQFLVLVSFLITFGLIRAITHLQKFGLIPNQGGNVHIHHLVPGIFLLLISGYIGISFWINRRFRLLMAILYGMGAALTIDEFALWLFLKDVYWSSQGRDSIDLIVITTAILLLTFLLSEIHDHNWLNKLKFSNHPQSPAQ